MIKPSQDSWHKSVAAGDSAGDISMLESVEIPIAFQP
jgi:phosphoserine phosphatase